jgi:hypothetical protein
MAAGMPLGFGKAGFWLKNPHSCGFLSWLFRLAIHGGQKCAPILMLDLIKSLLEARQAAQVVRHVLVDKVNPV